MITRDIDMTSLFNHILVAIDLSSNAENLLKKALKLAEHFNAKLTVLHVIEPTPATEHIFVNQEEYKKIAIEESKKELKSLGVFKHIKEKDCLFEFGSPKTVILDLAEKIPAQLIVIGSHGRHGWKKILGSTTNAILNDAKTDVFVFRETEDE